LPALYHVRVHHLARKLADHIRREDLLTPGDRVGVAVSGGPDSVALLCLLLELKKELGIVLSIAHLNHKLRGEESDADERFVADLAGHHKREFHAASVDVPALAADTNQSLEAAARYARYAFFRRLLGDTRTECPTLEFSSSLPEPPLDKIATGHTLDDQAETVLMRTIRGTGLQGLGGIYPRVIVDSDDSDEPGQIVRPLLLVRRRAIEQYLNDLEQPWREDATNRDTQFTRNRVRHTLLPLLEREFNPTVTESLSDLSEIARAEQDYWESEASGWMGTTVHWFDASRPAATTHSRLVQLDPAPASDSPLPEGPTTSVPLSAAVDLAWLLAQPLAVQRRVVKSIGEAADIPLEFKHVEEALRFASEENPPGKHLLLPGHWSLAEQDGSLLFLAPSDNPDQPPVDYQYRLSIPGQVEVKELHAGLQAVRLTPSGPSAAYNPEHLYDPALLARELTVRNWRAGDRFWPAHTKSPKKIKELLQERHITGAERKLWPVVVSGDEVIWVRGFPAPARFLPRSADGAVILICEAPLADGKF
jgi:tRNA(Ile)-lysidine synthase